MRALTFVSMLLLAVSGATAQSVTAESVGTVAAASVQTKHADLATSRICKRCLFGG